MGKFSILIVAYKAAATLKRALLSARAQNLPVLVILDGPDLEAENILQSLGDGAICWHVLPENRGVGYARQKALDLCQSDHALWLDADDVLAPRHAQLVGQKLRAGYDYVFPKAQLFRGDNGAFVKILDCPDSVQADKGILWQFARNFIPSVGWPGINVARARAIGYDVNLRHAEDYDHHLKAIWSGAKMGFSDAISYYQYGYATSLSRQLDRQNAAVEQILHRYDWLELKNRLSAADFTMPALFELGAMFLSRRRDWQILRSFCRDYNDYPDREKKYFYEGLAEASLGNWQKAYDCFTSALTIKHLPEFYNNLAVCAHKLGKAPAFYLQKALALRPDYLDARLNDSEKPERLTYVFLRGHSARDDYQLPTIKKPV